MPLRRARLLRRNPSLLFWAKVLVNFKSLNAVISLFYLHRGLGIHEVVWLSGIFGVVTLLTEIPSGYLADRIGRKRTMALGVALLIASSAIHWFAVGFPVFAVAFVFLASAGSCFSGTEEALLYDSLKEQGREGEMLRQNSRLLSAQNLPKIFLPSLGAFLAQGLTDAQFHLLIGADLVGSVAALVVLAFVVEPRHAKDVSSQEAGIFRESLATIRAHPALLTAGVNKAIPLVAVLLVWRIYQPFLLEHGISVVGLALFYVCIHTIMFSLKWVAERIERCFGSGRVLDATAGIMAALALSVVFARSGIALFALIGILFIAHNIREPMYSHWIHAHIRSRSRATTLSNLNVLKSAFDIPVMLAGGLLAAADLRYAFALAAGLCLSVLVFFRVDAQDVTDV